MCTGPHLSGERKMADTQEDNSNLRAKDLYAWSKETERLLFEHRVHKIDWDAVAVELERSAEMNDAKPMREAVEMLLTHLALWNISASYHGPQRHFQIESARFKLEELLSRSPSLTKVLDAEWRELYARARFNAMLVLRESTIERELLTLTQLIRAESDAEAEAISATRRSLRSVPESARDAYESNEDHYAWCREQAAAARSTRFSELDPLAIAEEIASVGCSVRRAVVESLAKLIDHLIAWQLGLRSPILRKRIALDRAAVRAMFWQNPSLAGAPELMSEAYKSAGRERGWVAAASSTAPEPCPWTLSQVLDDAFVVE